MIDIAKMKTRLEPVLDRKDPTHHVFHERLKQLESSRPSGGSWTHYRNFWPPAVLEALRSDMLVVFMGAGVSVASKLPSWRDLLEQKLGVPAAFLADDYLKSDNLTLGEISARLLGREQLQHSLRTIYNSGGADPTLIHYSLAALELPIYITTNYDDLFEKAWRKIYGREISVICNDSDAARYQDEDNKIYKIHGSAARTDEMLVLTRSDYRQHYRINEKMFDEVRQWLGRNPTLFTGFSHTDPEVGRLIDDVIFEFERQRQFDAASTGPAFYNMQFEDAYVVNERFAAKGMVSLTVRTADGLNSDVRTGGVAASIAELADATGNGLDRLTSLDAELAKIVDAVSASFERAIAALAPAAAKIGDTARGRKLDASTVHEALQNINVEDALGTQGIYVVDADGSIVEDGPNITGRRYDNLDRSSRDHILNDMRHTFADRPYFQKAKTYRRPFVSDLFESVFNKNSTFAVCHPILNDGHFVGLIFSAAQVGQWKLPLEIAKGLGRGLGVYLMDSQGVVAMPPNQEFEPNASACLLIEPEELRLGFSHLSLRLLSRKDRIILRLAENIVPIEKDDDVLSLDKRLDVYARIQTVGGFEGWRCSVTRTIEFTR